MYMHDKKHTSTCSYKENTEVRAFLPLRLNQYMLYEFVTCKEACTLENHVMNHMMEWNSTGMHVNCRIASYFLGNETHHTESLHLC